MANLSDDAVEGLGPPSILPPHYWVGSILGMLGARFLIPLSPVLAPDQMNYGFALGLAALTTGIWFAYKGSRQFTEVGTNIVPFTPASSLVTNGVFRISRNPMYTGMVLGLFGAALMTNQLWSWLFVVAFTLIIRYRFIAREENQMYATFGDEFTHYQKKIRRWL